MTTLLLQLSDLHIREPGKLAYGRIETAPYLKRAIDSVLRLPQQPHAVIITGDLTDFGRAAEYEHLRELLAPLPMPVYLMPGNHDDRDQLRSSFPESKFLVLSTDKVGPVIGEEIRNNALTAALLAMLGIMIYVAFRYEFSFAVAAVGQTVAGVINVLDAAVTMEIQLPGVLGMIASGLKARLQKVGQMLLTKE